MRIGSEMLSLLADFLQASRKTLWRFFDSSDETGIIFSMLEKIWLPVIWWGSEFRSSSER